MANPDRQFLHQAKRIVIKLGTHVIVDKRGRPLRSRLEKIVADVAQLQAKGHQVIVVSSGAIGVGLAALKWPQRPSELPRLQMAAAVGQTQLLTLYRELFAKHRLLCSQVLLTHDDLRQRQRHLNARNTLLTLLDNGVVPIINENDVVAVDEIKVGDNDVLSSLVSVLIEADLLVLLTTPNGLLKTSASGRKQRIPFLEKITPETLALTSGGSSQLGTGGMASKLEAAANAAKVGIPVIIASGLKPPIVSRLIAGEDLGTLIAQTESSEQRLKRRKRWIRFFHRSQGQLQVDPGAEIAITQQNKSLLPIGITKVHGQFQMGALVDITNGAGQLIAQGLVDFSSNDLMKIKGKPTSAIEKLLGHQDFQEAVHRDNLVLMDLC